MAAALQVRVAEEEPVTNTTNEKDSKQLRNIRLGRADDLSLYEISEHELAQLEAGSPVSVLLNCATFAAGVFVSTLSVLLSVDFPAARVWEYLFFLVLTVVSGSVAAVCTAVWWRYGQSNKVLVRRIRDRLKEDVEPPNPKPPPRPPPLAGPTESDTDP